MPETYDGNAPYVIFETSEISLPPSSPIAFPIDFKTNMVEPVIRIDLPESDVEGDLFAALLQMYEPDMQEGGACRLELEIFPNRTGLPQDLFKSSSKLRYADYTFLNCKLLKTIPAAIFDYNRQISSVEGLFAQSYNIEGESPYTLIDGRKVHLYEREKYSTEFVAIDTYRRCFDGCTKLSDYKDLPDNWR